MFEVLRNWILNRENDWIISDDHEREIKHYLICILWGEKKRDIEKKIVILGG